MESREDKLLPDGAGYEAGEEVMGKSREVGQVVKEIGQRLNEMAKEGVEVLPEMVQRIEQVLYCMAYARAMRRVSPAMTTFLMAAALTMFGAACADTGNAKEDKPDDTKVYEVDVAEEVTDTKEPDTGTVGPDTKVDTAVDTLPEIDSSVVPDQTEVDQFEIEDADSNPTIWKILQEELEWTRYDNSTPDAYIQVVRKQLYDCSQSSSCPYEQFVYGPQEEPSEDQNYIILRDPIPNDIFGGTTSTRPVKIAKYDICAVGDDFEISSITGDRVWSLDDVHYKLTAPDGASSITRTFDSDSDVHRIAAGEEALFTMLPDGECIDLEVWFELPELESPGFSAVQHKISNIVAAGTTDYPVDVRDNYLDWPSFSHSIIVGNLDDNLGLQSGDAPQEFSLQSDVFPCFPTEVVPAWGSKLLQMLVLRADLDSLIEDLRLPKVAISSSKAGTYTFTVHAMLKHGNSRASLVSEVISLDFQEGGSQTIALPYSIDLKPGQKLFYEIYLTEIGEIDAVDSPVFEMTLVENGVRSTNDSEFDTTLFVLSEDPEFEYSGEYDSDETYKLQRTSFAEQVESENFVSLGKDYDLPINYDRDSYAFDEKRLREGCYRDYMNQWEPCPIASLGLSIQEFLTVVDGETVGSEAPYVLDRYKFRITSNHFDESVSAHVVLTDGTDVVWGRDFEIQNGAADYYLVTEIDNSLPSSAVQILLPPEGIQGLNGCTGYSLYFYVAHDTPVVGAKDKLTQFAQPGQITVSHKDFDISSEASPGSDLKVIFEGNLVPGSFNYEVVDLDDVAGVDSPTISFEEPYALVESCSPPYTMIESGEDAELFCLEVIETNGPSALSYTRYGINSDWTQPAEDIYEVVDHPNSNTHWWTPTQETTLAFWDAEDRRVEFSDGQNYGWEVDIAPENSPLENRKSQPMLQVKADAISQLIYEGGVVPEPDEAFIVMNMEEMAVCDTDFGCEEGQSGVIPVYTTHMDPDTYEITLVEVSPDNPITGPIVFVSQ